MKKPITVIALLAGVVTGFSQGQIQMFDYSDYFAIQIFTSSSAADSVVPVSYGGYLVNEEQGNTVGDDHPGTTAYTGAPLGNGYDVELLAGPAGSPLAALTPVAGSLVTSWLTGPAAGYWNSPTPLPAISGTTTTATVAIAAWDNKGGAITSLAAAQLAGAPWGISDTALTAPLGYGYIPPPWLPAGLTSFSLGASAPISVVPEPGTIALGLMGASAFLLRLRRKQ